MTSERDAVYETDSDACDWALAFIAALVVIDVVGVLSDLVAWSR